jgi:hypothetical protein
VRSARPLDECIREVLGAQPQITRLYLLIGAITSPEVRNRLSAMPQGERDEVMRAAFERAFPGVSGVSTRLGAEQFAISGGDGVATALSDGDPDFETAMNSALAGEVLGVAPTSR